MNPFHKHFLHHYEMTYEILARLKPNKILDFGTGNAEFVSQLTNICKHLYAFDVDKGNIKKASKKFPYLHLKYSKPGVRISYGKNKFDAITMFHVLEHVDNEVAALANVAKLVKKNGYIFLASPYRGLFTWADTANLRFRFPALHNYFGKMILGRKEYARRFIVSKKMGLVGDCTANRKWHKHYKENEIRGLLSAKFKIVALYKFSLFHPFLLVVNNIIDYVFGKKSILINNIIYADNKLNAGEFSYNFLVVAQKR